MEWKELEEVHFFLTSIEAVIMHRFFLIKECRIHVEFYRRNENRNVTIINCFLNLMRNKLSGFL